MLSIDIKDYGDTNFITGMRAFAALAVVFIHVGGAGFRELGFIGNNIANFGRVGVYIFFVISGFSITSSYMKKTNYFLFLIKRLLRIMPLYYFWLAATILSGVTSRYWQNYFNVEIDGFNIFLHMIFLLFIDYRVANSIIGVEWSISVEVFWYFALPLLLIGGSSKEKSLLVLLAALIIYLLAVNFSYILPVDRQNAELAMHWSPIPYVLAYALGIAAYRYRSICIHSNTVGNCILILAITLIGVYICLPSVITKTFYDEFIFVCLVTTLLLLFGTNKSLLFRLTFNNSAVQFIGVLSYGIYLCHIPLLGLIQRLEYPMLNNQTLLFILVLTLSVIVSTLTYFLIEKRFVLVGKRIEKVVL